MGSVQVGANYPYWGNHGKIRVPAAMEAGATDTTQKVVDVLVIISNSLEIIIHTIVTD